jgi:hypothetical protein
MRQLWFAAYADILTLNGGPTSDIPYADPLALTSIDADTSSVLLDPGAMSFWRLDTPSGSSSVTIRFAGPGGAPLLSNLHPQLSIFRLPPGQ